MTLTLDLFASAELATELSMDFCAIIDTQSGVQIGAQPSLRAPLGTPCVWFANKVIGPWLWDCFGSLKRYLAIGAANVLTRAKLCPRATALSRPSRSRCRNLLRP